MSVTSVVEEFRQRFPKPDGLWTPQWRAIADALTVECLSNPDLQRLFAEDLPLPPGYGMTIDERVVEWPWVLAQGPSGRMLDAGSALNHPLVLQSFAPRLNEFQIFTLEPEHQAFWQAKISYVFGDLREMPYRDGWFDFVTSISTLEHVGMDNTIYGSGLAKAENATRETRLAVQEVMRVIRPGGTFAVTVPYGVAEDLGRHRTFDRPAVEDLVDAAGGSEAAVTAYRYDAADGWMLSTLDEAAHLRYRDHEREPFAPDGAVAARAVACVKIVK